MKRALVSGLMALLLAGCSISADVVGKVGDKVYRGLATGYMDRSGTIEMTSADGSRCAGQFRYTGAKYGIGLFQCNDGHWAEIQFNAIGSASGYGYGKDDSGRAVRFAYGLPEEEAKIYLKTPNEQASTSEPDKGKREEEEEGGTVSAGTGFFINTKGHVLTNNHVVQGCRDLIIQLPDGDLKAGHVVAWDSRNDLAVIRVRTEVKTFATFNLGAHYRQGDVVMTYGYPLPGTLTTLGNLTVGNLSALSGVKNNSRDLQISVPVQPGNSGGPLVDAKGNVIGVIVSGLDDLHGLLTSGAVPQNVNFAIKDVVAKTFLDAHRIPYTETRKTAVLSPPDIGDQMKEYVVWVICEG